VTPVVFVRGAVLPPELCAVLADRLDDPGWRASLAPDDAAAVAAVIQLGHAYRDRGSSSGSEAPSPRTAGQDSVHDLLDVPAAAARAGVTARAVRYAAQDGRLRGSLAGSRWLFAAAAVDTYAATIGQHRRPGHTETPNERLSIEEGNILMPETHCDICTFPLVRGNLHHECEKFRRGPIPGICSDCKGATTAFRDDIENNIPILCSDCRSKCPRCKQSMDTIFEDGLCPRCTSHKPKVVRM